MALIISPKTTQKQIDQLSRFFNLQKIPKDEAKLELGNFNDNFYQAKINRVPVYIILTGYGGASVGFAVAQYEKNYKPLDPHPEAYFIGSIFKPGRVKKLELGDILYAKDTFGQDEWSGAIYKIAQKQKIKSITKPDKKLVERILKLSKKQKLNLKSGKILSRWYPGFLSHYQYVLDLLDAGMWWKLALYEGEFKNHGFDGGEIESAAFTATCNLAKIPSIALLDVRDERLGKGYDKNNYRMADDKIKEKAQKNILKLIKLSLEE